MSALLKFETMRDGHKIAALLIFGGWYQDTSCKIAQWSLNSASVDGKQTTPEIRARLENWLREERWSAIGSAFVGAGS